MAIKNVLVTGGAGFVGSHIADYWVQKNIPVTILDNLSTGSLENLTHIQDNVTFIEGDITDEKTCHRACQNISLIFHCAAHVSVPQSQEDPSGCYASNVLGTLNLLEAAEKNKVKRFIFSSSSAVYGSQSQACCETMIPKPESPYGHSKLLGELLCKRFSQQRSLETVSLRYFNVFGPRQSANSPYSSFYALIQRSITNNAPITIFGDGLQTRDFVSVEKVVQTNVLASKLHPKFAQGLVMNVASGKSVSLLELIDTVAQKHGAKKPEILFKPTRTGDIKYSQADCSLLEKFEEEYRSL